MRQEPSPFVQRGEGPCVPANQGLIDEIKEGI
jgi:hypothetical protein